MRYERLPEANGNPQIRVTYITQTDLRGLIPKALVNSKMVSQLKFLSDMRKKFDKSLEVDAGRRAEITSMIKQEE